MSSRMFVSILLLASILAVVSAPAAIAQGQTDTGNPLYVMVDGQTLRVRLPRVSGEVKVAALACYEQWPAAGEIVWEGRGAGRVIRVPRFAADGRDRLYDRFVVIDKDTNRAFGSGAYADKLDRLEADGVDAVWPGNIKGIQDPKIDADLAELGVSHITLNIRITTLIARPARPNETGGMVYDVDGHRYLFNASVVRGLDVNLQNMHARDINVLAILLCTWTDQDGGKPLIPMNTKSGDAPHNIMAVNLDHAEGERRYRAVVGFLARRYSRADNRFGRLGGYIIGNEVNSHWAWHHQGPADPSDAIEQYANQVRLSYYAAREHHPAPRVFISLDHFWQRSFREDRQQTIPGREMLDRIAERIREQGDLPWQVAHHPYPQNLRKPDFWNDGTAWFAYDTPRITYNNIEVLLDYLKREELLYENAPRRVILSEQGFNAGHGEAEERLQAAAYALAHIKLSQLDGIDAHILHRHTDHPNEGGLKLGVRVGDAQGRPTRKRLMFDVFAAAGTDRQDEVFAFALPIIGIESWAQARPPRGPFPETRP